MPKIYAIIGGGAAGIGAAYTILEKSSDAEVHLFEATGRYGGRANTDLIKVNGKDLPFDKGPVYVQDPNAPDNPWKGVAKDLGFQTVVDDTDYEIRINLGQGYQTMPTTGVTNIQNIVDNIQESYDDNKGYLNEPVVEKLKPWELQKNQWFALGLSPYGSFVESAEPWQYIAADRAREADGNWGNNLFVKEGFGKLVQRYGEKLTTNKRFTQHLNALVREIDYSGKKVVMSYGNNQTFTVDACLVTVSVGVLANDKIKFKPQLPDAYETALQALKLGSYKKLAIQFNRLPDSDVIEDNVNYYIYENSQYKGTQIQGIWQFYRLSFYPPNVLVVHASGDFAEILDQLIDRVVYKMFCETFKQAYNDYQVKFKRLLGITNWNNDPYTLGAYSYTAPLIGQGTKPTDKTAYNARKQMAKAIDKKLFFAGEALSLQAYATVQGAYWSGQDSAVNLLYKQGELS